MASGMVEVSVIPRFCCAVRAARRAEGVRGDLEAPRPDWSGRPEGWRCAGWPLRRAQLRSAGRRAGIVDRFRAG